MNIKPEYITEVVLQVVSVAESCLEVGLYLGPLGLQALIGPVVDCVLVFLPTVVVGRGVIQPDDQPEQPIRTLFSNKIFS